MRIFYEILLLTNGHFCLTSLFSLKWSKSIFPEVLSDKWLLHLCGFDASLLECFVSSQAGVFLMPYFPLRVDKWIWEWNVPPCDDETFTTAELRCICFKEALRLNNFSTQSFLNPQLPIHRAPSYRLVLYCFGLLILVDGKLNKYYQRLNLLRPQSNYKCSCPFTIVQISLTSAKTLSEKSSKTFLPKGLKTYYRRFVMLAPALKGFEFRLVLSLRKCSAK